MTRRTWIPTRLRALSSACIVLTTVSLLGGCAAHRPPPPIAGVVWQVSLATTDPVGQWDRLGARELLVQWMVVDDTAFLPGLPGHRADAAPDWDRIASEPWAERVIVGLVGRSSEREARADVAGLAARSAELARRPMPVAVSGWYFPVEVDPSWQGAADLGPLLADLPRPLWLSVYDRQNIGPEAFADWLETWVPADVGILFQDGVGEHVRGPAAARDYFTSMERRLGRHRVGMIAEAFRPAGNGRFRGATVDELRAQLDHYRHVRLYLFDGPHYVPDEVVAALLGGA